MEPVRRALDVASATVTLFVRDDDVGWADEPLFALLDVFADLDVPIDLAIIPCALEPALARRLKRRRQPIDVHQHGYAHANHERAGRKCEFGDGRSFSQQRADIALGRARLHALFGPGVQSIFTPPWNRCTADTAAALVDLGFRMLSRDTSAGELSHPRLAEVPVTFDWFAKRKGAPLSRAERGELLANQVATGARIGIMLHHALMDGDEMSALRELLALLIDHPRARLSSMRAAAHIAS